MPVRSDPKYVIPRQPDNEVVRSQLLERLFAAHEKRLILTIAPAGYGKSTLLAQFARKTNRSIAWINLSAEDSEALVLSRSVAQAVCTALPKADLPQWQRAASRDGGTEQLATALAADLNLFSEDLVIALETLEHLSEESGRWVKAFLDRLGEGHQVIATSWDWGESVTLDVSRFIASGQALVLNQDALAFTFEETKELFHQANSSQDAREVWEAVEGWPAALGMILYGAPLQGTPQDLIRGILRNIPKATRDTLPEAAVLTTWSKEEAVELGLNLPPSWLVDVQRTGLPLQVLGSNRFQPHRVLIDALEETLRERPERHKELHLKAAELAELKGDLITAVNHFRVATHFEQARRVLDGLIPRYQRRSEWMLVRKILEPFPLEALSPYAATMLGTALIETHAASAGSHVLNELRIQGNASGATYFALALIAFRQGAFQEVVKLTDEGLAIAKLQRDVVELLRMKAGALASSNRLDEALFVSEECLRRAERLGEPGLLPHALAVHQFALTQLNRYEESLAVGRRAIDLALHKDVPKKAMSALDAYAETLWLTGRAEEARLDIEEMLTKSEYDYPLAVPFMMHRRGQMYDQLEQYDQCLQDYRTAINLFLSFDNKSSASATLVNAADVLLFLDQKDQAQELLSQANEYIHAEDIESQLKVKRVEGTLYFSRHDFDRARETFEWVRRQAKQQNSLFEVVVAHGYLTTITQREGTLERQTVEKFMNDLDAFGYDWILRRYAKVWRNFYRECVENGWYTERLRPYLSLQKPGVPLPTKPKLELKLFGTPYAKLSGKTVKLTSRPHEVLSYLVLNGATRVDVLADAIWPQASPRSAKRNLAQQIRSLRESLAQAVGSGRNILTTGEGLYSLSESIEITSDIGRLEKAQNSGDVDEMLLAVEHYDSELLPHLYTEWVLQHRQHYEHLAVALTLTLARLHRKTSPHLAIELYEKVISIDLFNEVAYHELMEAHEAMNNHAGALYVERRLIDLVNNIKKS